MGRKKSKPSCLSHLHLEAEAWEVMDLESESEVESEDEVEAKDHWRFYRPCIWINSYFTRLRVLLEGAVAAAAVALEEKDRDVPGGGVVGEEVDSG